MKYDIRFVDEIEDDLLNAYQWYQSKSSELGADMLDEIYKKFLVTTVSVVMRTPL